MRKLYAGRQAEGKGVEPQKHKDTKQNPGLDRFVSLCLGGKNRLRGVAAGDRAAV